MHLWCRAYRREKRRREKGVSHQSPPQLMVPMDSSPQPMIEEEIHAQPSRLTSVSGVGTFKIAAIAARCSSSAPRPGAASEGRLFLS